MVLYDHGCGSSNIGMAESLPLLELYEATISWMCPTLKWHGVSRVEMLMRGAWRQRRCNINPRLSVDQGRQLELLKFQDREVRSENQCSPLWWGGYSQEWQCRAHAWRPAGLQINLKTRLHKCWAGHCRSDASHWWHRVNLPLSL